MLTFILFYLQVQHFGGLKVNMWMIKTPWILTELAGKT